MSQKSVLKTYLNVALIAVLVSCGVCCIQDEWACHSGQCIKIENLCNGATDCKDGSDETVDSCNQMTCPLFAFQCAYGACVHGAAKCDNIKDCADNSDETFALCKGGKSKERKSICSGDEFNCASDRECIGLDKVCNGHSDCKDNSDESLETCASNECPNFAFRCGYGACISMDRKCDSNLDCRDGSDEASVLCGIPLPIGKPRPTPNQILTKIGCIAPSIPNSRVVYKVGPPRVIAPGEMLAEGASIKYECMPQYTRVGQDSNYCKNSQWISPHAQCIQYCDANKLKGITFKADCKKDDVSVSCDGYIEPGTIAEISCNIQYRPQESSIKFLKCEADGMWDYLPQSCLPECGKSASKIKGFIAGGAPTETTQVPWHVAIYENFSGEYKHICDGTLISATVVISAAHCFWDTANKKLYESSYFAIGAGKYYRDYYKSEQYAQYQNVSAIHAHRNFNDEDDSYKFDIAVLLLTNFLILSPFVAPACLDWQEGSKKLIGSNISGKVAGWVLNENENYGIEIHNASTRSFDDCINEIGLRWINTITSDKFCVVNQFATPVCGGDSGGGVVFEKPSTTGGSTRHYLWGIVSGRVPSNRKCTETEFVTSTNIQYYEDFVVNIANSKRPQ